MNHEQVSPFVYFFINEKKGLFRYFSFDVLCFGDLTRKSIKIVGQVRVDFPRFSGVIACLISLCFHRFLIG